MSLRDLRGKIVILNFWATWCGNCIQEMPSLAKIARSHPSVVVLAVSVGDTRKAFREWLAKRHDLDLIVFALDPVGIDGVGIDAKLYKASGLPTSYIVDQRGKIADSFVGFGPNSISDIENALGRVESQR